METGRALLAVIGITQAVIGVLFGALAVLLGLGVIDVQAVFTAPPEFLSLYLLAFVLFSVFSVLSALFLIREWRKE